MSTDKKFPSESCREKIARRHGADAVALSGPCKGSSLADCVCKQIEDRFDDVSRRFAGSESKVVRLATKLSDSFMSNDDSEECLAALGTLGYSKQASSGITDYLEAYAMHEAVAMELESLMGDIEGEDSDADEPVIDEALGDLVEIAPEEEPVGHEVPDEGGLEDVITDEAPEGIDEGIEIEDVGDVGDVAEETVSVEFEIPKAVVEEIVRDVVEGDGGAGEEIVEGPGDLGGEEMVEFEVIEEGEEAHEEQETELIEDLGELHEESEEVPGEPEESQEPGIQVVEGGEGETCEACGQSKEASMKHRVKIAYPEHGSGGHDASGGSNKKVEDPNAIADGNLETEGHSAGDKKFQDGSTLGSEKPFDAATVEASDVSGGSASLQGEDESFPEGGPSVPAGSSPIKNEELTGGDVATKGTVIATVTPDGIQVKTPDGKVLLAKTKIAKNQVTKELLDAISAIEFDGDGRKYAKNALLAFRKIAQPIPAQFEGGEVQPGAMRGFAQPEQGRAGYATSQTWSSPAGEQVPVELTPDEMQKASGVMASQNVSMQDALDQVFAQTRPELLKSGDEAGFTQQAPTGEFGLEASITPNGIAFKLANGKAYLAKVAIATPTKELVAAIESLPFDGDIKKFAQAAVNAVKTTKTASEEGVTKTDTSKLEDNKFTNDDGPMEAEDEETVGKSSGKSEEDGVTKIDTAEKEAEHFQNKDYENDKVDSGGSKEAASAKATKTANENKKVEDPKPIADGNLETEGYSAGDKKFQDGSTMGAEKPFDAHKVADSEVSGGTSSLMGEDESLPTDKPSVPAGSGPMGDEPWSGGDVSTKGTTIAENQAKVREARIKAAAAYVADLLQHGDIDQNEYSETLEKTASMSVQAIQQLAFSTKKARSRMAKTAADREAMVKEASSQPGFGVPVVVSASNNRNDDLKDRLVNAFKLTKTLDDYDSMKEKN